MPCAVQALFFFQLKKYDVEPYRDTLRYFCKLNPGGKRLNTLTNQTRHHIWPRAAAKNRRHFSSPGIPPVSTRLIGRNDLHNGPVDVQLLPQSQRVIRCIQCSATVVVDRWLGDTMFCSMPQCMNYVVPVLCVEGHAQLGSCVAPM